MKKSSTIKKKKKTKPEFHKNYLRLARVFDIVKVNKKEAREFTSNQQQRSHKKTKDAVKI